MKTPFHGALTLLVFLLTIIGTYALAPVSLKLRIPRTAWRVPLHFCWIPWLSTAFLLLFQALTPKELGSALAGSGTLRPATFVVTYLSLSYLAVSCEITGLYGWLALQLARRTRGKPLLLLAALVGLSGVLSAATCADVSLVALTPIMVYTAMAANWDTMSLAATHMGAASVSGMLVAVSGPSNILAAQAFGLSFMPFLAWMALPTLAAAGVTLGLLYLLLHRRRLASGRYDAVCAQMPYPDPGLLLHDQVGAAFSSATLTVCLLALAVGPSLKWSGWAVAAVFAAVAALYNLVALLGPLKSTIGRRGAYERRKRLHAELAQQGLRRALSDEDLADLLLSAAQHREASFTRLAAATARRVGSTATLANTASGAASVPGGHLPSSHHPESAPGTSSAFAGILRLSNSGRGFSMRPSSSNGMLAHAASSTSTGGSTGGGGGGGGGSSSLGSLTSGGSPVRHWFSQRWSSLRGWTGSVPLTTDLVEAAADAGANLCLLGGDNSSTGHVVATGGGGGSWRGGSGGAGRLRTAAAEPAGGGDGMSLRRGGKEPGAGGYAAAAMMADTLPACPRMSIELRQLLTHGTVGAPDTPEWWAAAAHSAQELLQVRAPSLSAAGAGALAPYPSPPSYHPVDMYGPGYGGADVATGAFGSRQVGTEAPAGALTSESAFADAGAMQVPGWDGGLAGASACNPRAGTEVPPSRRPVSPGLDIDKPASGDGPVGITVSVAVSHGRSGSPPRQPASLKEGPGESGASHRVPPGVVEGPPGAPRPEAGSPLPSAVRSPRAPQQLVSEGGAACVITQQRPLSGTSAGGPGGHKHRAACGSIGGGGVAAPHTSTDPRDTCSSDSGSGDAGSHSVHSGLRSKGPAVGGTASSANSSRSGGHFAGNASSGDAAAEGGAAGAAAAVSYHDPTHMPDQRRPLPGTVRPGSVGEEGPTWAVHEPVIGTKHAYADNTVGAPAMPSSGQGRWSFDAGPISPTEPLLPAGGSVGAGAGGGGGGDGEDDSEGQDMPLPSSSGLAGLFGFWRQDTKDEGESAALLAASRAAAGGGCGGASDDPRHVQLSLATTPTSAVASLAWHPLVTPQAGGPAATPGKGKDPLAPDLERGGPTASAGGPTGGTAAPGTTPCSRSARSPFGRWGQAGFRADSSGPHSSHAAAVGYAPSAGGGGGGISLVSIGNSIVSAGLSTGWGVRPPSLSLLLLGPSEVTFPGTFAALPWANVVLLLGMFVMVEALQVHGWVDSLTQLLNAMLGAPGPSPSPPPSSAFANSRFASAPPFSPAYMPTSTTAAAASAVFAMGCLSAGLATGMTGQSALLLLARAMTSPAFLAVAGGAGGSNNADAAVAATAAARRGAQLSLVVAANLAPALALSGSLTAMRWGLGLRQLGVRLRCCRYMVSGLLPAALAGMAAALLVLWGQCVAWE